MYFPAKVSINRIYSTEYLCFYCIDKFRANLLGLHINSISSIFAVYSLG